MARKRIGVDFDDVLASTGEAVIDWHNKKYGTDHALEDLKNFGFEHMWNCSVDVAVERVHEFYPTTPETPPIPGAISGIKALAEKHELVLITGRSDIAVDVTHAWLEKHLPGIFETTYFTNQFHGEKKMSKAEFCRAHNIDILIDDFMGTAENVSKEGIPVLLYDRPWNQGEIPEKVTRVHSWEEILKQI
jgi:uncharacterized HAD superfamily protein